MMFRNIILWKILLLVFGAGAQLQVGIPAPPVMVLPETFNTELLTVEGPMAVLPPLPASSLDVRPQPLTNPAPPLTYNSGVYQLTTTPTPTSTLSSSLFPPPTTNRTFTSSPPTSLYPANRGRSTSTVSTNPQQVGRPQLSSVGSQSVLSSTTPGTPGTSTNYQTPLPLTPAKPPSTRSKSNGSFIIEIDELENKNNSHNITLTISNVSNGTKFSLKNDQNSLD